MVCRFGPAFRMRVLGCNLKPFDLPDVEQVDFDTLLASSDAISIHIHMLRENYHLFNEHVFDRMKPGAVLVNTSRGDIIDETALLNSLESGRLAAFGADVLHNEWRFGHARITNRALRAGTRQRVDYTPHRRGQHAVDRRGKALFSPQACPLLANGRRIDNALKTPSPHRTRCQKVAIGFNGDPVPPPTGNGEAVNKNSQRPSLLAVLLKSCRSQLSKM